VDEELWLGLKNTELKYCSDQIMNPTHALLVALLIAPLAGAESVPFDREAINRYSLDNLPRSLSIRQGQDVWLGYDLERATLRKVWQAPAGKPGLVTSGFTVRSIGTAWFEDQSAEKWKLRREGKAVPLSVRYVGCSQREDRFELSWELRHAGGVLKLLERIPIAPEPASGRVTRALRVDGLAPDEALLLPFPAGEAWKLIDTKGDRSAPNLTGAGWHQLILP
jgi:hypothetical protein